MILYPPIYSDGKEHFTVILRLLFAVPLVTSGTPASPPTSTPNSNVTSSMLAIATCLRAFKVKVA
jgi:hypothetical protein